MPVYTSLSNLCSHMLKPFHKILIQPEANYGTLLESRPEVYSELTSIELKKLLKIEHVFKFVTEETFKDCFPDDDVLHV